MLVTASHSIEQIETSENESNKINFAIEKLIHSEFHELFREILLSWKIKQVNSRLL